MTAPLLNDATLAQMRAMQSANMLSACDLVGFTDTRGPGGTTVRTPVLIATVKCRLSLASSALPIVAAQLTPDAQFLLYLPFATDLVGVERMIVRGPNADAPTWEVQLEDSGTDEPRTFSASTRVRAKLASSTIDTSGL
jgi:hypothetical protein